MMNYKVICKIHMHIGVPMRLISAPVGTITSEVRFLSNSVFDAYRDGSITRSYIM